MGFETKLVFSNGNRKIFLVCCWQKCTLFAARFGMVIKQKQVRSYYDDDEISKDAKIEKGMQSA